MKYPLLIAAFLLSGCDGTESGTSLAMSTEVAVGAPPAAAMSASPSPHPTIASQVVAPAPIVVSQIMVPAYFTPGANNYWADMVTAQRSGVQVTAIFSPYFGPGTSTNPDYAAYTAAIKALRDAGGKVIGYVDTALAGKLLPAKGFSCQPKPPRKRYSVQDIVDCAQQYKTLYALDGIFLDQFGTSGSEADGVKFYRSVYNGIKQIDPNLLVVGNPGNEYVAETYLRRGKQGGADVLVAFESYAQNYEGAYVGTPFATYAKKYPAARFANILHSSAEGFNLKRAVAQSKKRNVGYIFITDDVLPNPYDTLPSYWGRFADTVRSSNTK